MFCSYPPPKSHQKTFEKLLGDGNELGIHIEYKIQDQPRGIADAFLLGEKFICGHSVALILGDNLFHGNDIISGIQKASSKSKN